MNAREDEPSVLIVGCGGIGGVLGFRLLDAGVDLTIATTNASVREAWLGSGPRLDGKRVRRTLSPERMVPLPADAGRRFDVAFVAVQPPQVEEVVHTIAPHLSERGRVVCLPNGLLEDRIARIVGPERVVGGVVAWGARMLAPGEYSKTSRGGFRVGSLDARPDPEIPRIEALLETVGPVERTENLRGARFSKLAINCAVSTLGTIGGRTVGELLGHVEVRRVALDVLSEAVRVAHAEGIRLEKVIRLDLDWLARLADRPSTFRTASGHALLLAVGVRYRKMRSSMLAAIERGRPPAVDFLNGEIVERGRRLGVPTPMNRAATEMVWKIARGESGHGLAAIRATYDLGRSYG